MVLKALSSLAFALSILLTPATVFAAEAENLTPQADPVEQAMQIDIQDEMSPEATYSMGFGYVNQKSTVVRSLYVRNTSYYPMAIYGVSLSGRSYYAFNYCPRYLGGHRQCAIRIFFQPQHRGFQTGYLYIYTNRGTYSVYLYGWGR